MPAAGERDAGNAAVERDREQPVRLDANAEVEREVRHPVGRRGGEQVFAGAQPEPVGEPPAGGRGQIDLGQHASAVREGHVAAAPEVEGP